MNIRTSIESVRGCGYRTPGSLYLVAGKAAAPCGKLPIPLHICPTCGHGIKPSRGWTWVDVAPLVEDIECLPKPDHCSRCPLSTGNIGKAGLLWIGEAFYKTPGDFLRESEAMGISRKINSVPRGFKIGETWVLMAHRKAIFEGHDPDGTPKYQAGVFHMFRPTAIEYIVKYDDDDERLGELEKKGYSLVKVVRSTNREINFDEKTA